MQNIALIRGINVGGNSRVSMSELKEHFKAHGFTNVSTYINSGNVLFESDEKDLVKLVETCETIVKDNFAVTTGIAVLPVAELHDALDHAPSWWNTDPASKHNAIFVIAPAKAEAVMMAVGEAKPEYEKVAHYKNVIFWSAPLQSFSHSRWQKIVGSAAYKDVTIRNANTAIKLRALTEPN